MSLSQHASKPSIAMFQPDMPQNLGSVLRLVACFGTGCEVIEPCGFPLDDKRAKRVGMDYVEIAAMRRHASWNAFKAQMATEGRRIVLLSSKAAVNYHEFAFTPQDVLMVGAESTGVPESITDDIPHRVVIPMQPPARCLNVAQAASIVLAEALRQVGAF